MSEKLQAERIKPGVMRLQLIAALNEPSGDGERSNLRAILDALIGMAKDQDLAAIREIFDRSDGKAMAVIPDDGEKKVTFEWRSNKPAAPTSSASDPLP